MKTPKNRTELENEAKKRMKNLNAHAVVTQKCFIVLAKNFGDKTRERIIWDDTCITSDMVEYWESHLDKPLAIRFSNNEKVRTKRGNYYETKAYIKEWGKTK